MSETEIVVGQLFISVDQEEKILNQTSPWLINTKTFDEDETKLVAISMLDAGWK